MEQKACHLQCNHIQSLPYSTFSHCVKYTLSPGSILSHRHSSCVTNPQFMHTLKKYIKKVILQLFFRNKCRSLKA